jgi:rSAM/selenodomain-associated transferase 1
VRNRVSVIIFARYPELGKVKTRLAATTSHNFALRFYKDCLSNLLNHTKSLPSDFKLALYCTNKMDEMRTLYGERFSYFLQSKGDLGAKMHHAFVQEFKTSEKVLIVGSDIPDLYEDIIVEAIDALDSKDAVMGETFDGGYYLLGLKKMEDSLFENMPWSTSEISKLTKQKLRLKKLSLKCLKTLRDIDTEEDLLVWKSNHLP